MASATGSEGLQDKGGPASNQPTPAPDPSFPSPLSVLPSLTPAPTGLCLEKAGVQALPAERFIEIQLQVTGDEVRGRETLHRFGVPVQGQEEPLDCTMQWSISGHVASPLGCSSCNLGATITATADEEANSCPQSMWEQDGGSFENAYDLHFRKDGTATLHFSRNGKLWAEGYHMDGQVHAVSEPSCEWF